MAEMNTKSLIDALLEMKAIRLEIQERKSRDFSKSWKGWLDNLQSIDALYDREGKLEGPIITAMIEERITGFEATRLWLK